MHYIGFETSGKHGGQPIDIGLTNLHTGTSKSLTKNEMTFQEQFTRGTVAPSCQRRLD